MTIYYKAVRPEGTSFYDPLFRWLPEDGVIPEGGFLVKHPDPAPRIGRESGASASHYLSLATVPTECMGMAWPCRLLAVEPVDRAALDNSITHKRRVRAARVVAELPATDALGPQSVHIAALIERAGALTGDEVSRMGPAWGAGGWDGRLTLYGAQDAALHAAVHAARNAARYAVRDAVRDTVERYVIPGGGGVAYDALQAAWDAVSALLVRDIILRSHYYVLTRPWRTAIGRIHPDDGEIA